MIRTIILLLACTAAVIAGVTGVAYSQTPTIDDLISINRVWGTRISPDGRYVTYTKMAPNFDEDKNDVEVWLVEVDGGKPIRLTNAEGAGSEDAKWSPDGKRLAFTSARDDGWQIYLISPSGGEPWRLTDAGSGGGSYEWSPDGSKIAFTARDPRSKEANAFRQLYGAVQDADEEPRMTHIWIVDVPDDPLTPPVKPHRLTQGQDFSVRGSMSWSPDSKSIAFSAGDEPGQLGRPSTDLYAVDVESKVVLTLAATPGPDLDPIWSPDGTQVVYLAQSEKFMYEIGNITVVSAEGGGTPSNLTAAFDGNPTLIAWGPDGIFFSASEKTDEALFLLDSTTGDWKRVASASDGISGFDYSFTANYQSLAFVGAETNQFFDVHVSSVSPFAPRRLTSLREQMLEFPAITREVVSWKSNDGTTVEGILFKPGDFDSSQKYPLLLVLHGGPLGIDRPWRLMDRIYPIESFVARGALVLKPNYRGSLGYGNLFRGLGVRNVGFGAAEDILSGVDSLIDQGFVDGERLGTMGWSYGGYLSAFLGYSTDRFRAVSVGAGIADWRDYYVGSDLTEWPRQFMQANPWDDPEIYAKGSPIAFVTEKSAPTLIQHGFKDTRVPFHHARAFYHALRDHDVPLKLFIFNSGHGISGPKQARAAMQQNYDWFGKWIWGDEPRVEVEDATGGQDK